MIVRLCREDEADKVLSLYKSVLGTEFCAWDEEYPSMEHISRDLLANGLYVLEENGKIVSAASIVSENEMDGFEAWRIKDGRHAEIARVVVSLECRGRGLAGKTVAAVLCELKSRGYTSVRLSVVRGHIPAHKTYFALGFEHVGTEFMYGDCFDLLEKRL